MIEILDDLDVLTRPTLDLSQLSLAGIRYGAPASSIPLERICEVTLAPIAASYGGGRYWDAQGKELSLAEVVQDVIANSGFLHFPEKVSFFISQGKVDRFVLRTTALKRFAHLTNQAEIEKVFGVADTLQREEAGGELIAYLSYYAGSRKRIWWSPEGGITLINLGVDS